MKKLGLILLVVVMLLATITACKTQETDQSTTQPSEAAVTTETTTAEETTEEVVPEELDETEISIAVWNIENSFPEGEELDALAQYFYDMFKIKWVPFNVTWGDYNEKIDLWAASGQLPDLFGAGRVGSASYYQWISDGVIRELPDDNVLEQYPTVLKMVNLDTVSPFMVDGKRYYLPRITYNDRSDGCMDAGITVRKDWMEALGYTKEQVESSEEAFLQMCVDFATKDPDRNGANDTVGIAADDLWPVYTVWSGYGMNSGDWVYDENGNAYISDLDEDGFRRLKRTRELYQAGAIDPDFVVNQVKGEGVNKYLSGTAGILVKQIATRHWDGLKVEWDKVSPDLDFFESNDILLAPPPSDGKVEYVQYYMKHHWSEMYISSAVDDAKMERVLKLYEFIYSGGHRMLLYGIEGTDWNMGANGEIEMLNGTKETGIPIMAADLYPFATGMADAFMWTASKQNENPVYDSGIRSVTNDVMNYIKSNWKTPMVDLQFASMDVEERQTLSIDKTGAFVNFIIDTSGKSDEQLWEEMIEGFNANGYQAACDAMTAAYKAQFGAPNPAFIDGVGK